VAHPRTLSDAVLERRLRDAARRRDEAGVRTWHHPEDGWSAGLLVPAMPPLLPTFIPAALVQGWASRREALEQLYLALGLAAV
jgi:hypothetical protein